MFTLETVPPWGRSFDEYRLMFRLDAADLRARILGCADGPASFNAEAARRGAWVVSCDPLYRWPASRIRERIQAVGDRVLAETRRNRGQFVWKTLRSVEQLGRVRMRAMEAFLDDFETGKREGRYVAAELPRLPFADHSFELALCSHLLFLYTEQLSSAFHESALDEMCRLAREVRIFPLIALDGRPSRRVPEAADRLRSRGFELSIEPVPYEFQRGANQMMRIRSRP